MIRIAAVLALVCTSVSVLCAQHEKGLALRFHIAAGWTDLRTDVNACDITSPTGNAGCPSYTSYTGAFAQGAFGLEYAITAKFHMGLEAGAVVVNGSSDVPGEQKSVVVRAKEYAISTSFHGATQSSYAYPRIFLSYYLPANFFVEVGAGTMFNLANSFTSSARLNSPGLVYFDSVETQATTFRNDNKEAYLYDEAVLSSAQDMRPFFDVGIGQSYHIDDLSIQLIARLQSGFPRDLKPQSIDLSMLGFGLTISHAL